MTRTNEVGETRAGAAVPNADTHESDTQPVYPHTMRLQRFLARAGVASRRGSEDLMTAGRVTVNGKVARASYDVKAGDVIDVVEGSRKIEKFAKLTGADAAVVALPSWLSRETGSLKGVVTKLPERSDIDFDVQEHLIVELYSK